MGFRAMEGVDAMLELGEMSARGSIDDISSCVLESILLKKIRKIKGLHLNVIKKTDYVIYHNKDAFVCRS